MATTVVSTIKASGGDYTSLANWEAGRQGDIITRDTIEVAECYAFSDTSTCHVNGWITDATHWIEIRTPLSERHNGVWTNSKYRLEGSVSGGYGKLFSWENNLRVFGLQISLDTSNTSGIRAIGSLQDGASDIRVGYNILRNSQPTTFANQFGLQIGATGFIAGSITRIYNNIIYDFAHNNSGYGILTYGLAANTPEYLYNNTVFGCYTNYVLNDYSKVKNCISAEPIFQNYSGTYHADSRNNASSGADAPGSYSRNSQTFSFIDKVGKNFHLAANDVGAKGFGFDLSGDVDLPFNDDIDNVLRVAPWDIGADQFMLSGHPAYKRFGGVPFVAINKGVW